MKISYLQLIQKYYYLIIIHNYNLLPSENLKEFYNGINDFLNPNNKLDDDDSIPLNCKYVDIESFNHLKNKTQFSLFHLNIVSLAKNKNDLQTILSLLDYKFDIIGLTETKIIKDITPTFDMKMNGYKLFSTPTEAEKGGSIIYVAEEYNSKPRKDLDSLIYKSKELESVFIELINPGQKTL